MRTGRIDCDSHALAAILAEWTRTDAGYATRIDHLSHSGRRNGEVRLTANEVFDDRARDQLTGSSGQDWFFATFRPGHHSGSDRLSDWRPGELLTPTPVAQRYPASVVTQPRVDWGLNGSKALEAPDVGEALASNIARGINSHWARRFVLDLGETDPNADLRIVPAAKFHPAHRKPAATAKRHH